MSYIAHFSPSGELLAWRWLSPGVAWLMRNRAGDIVVVSSSLENIPVDPPTEDVLFRSGSVSMLVLAPDLKAVRIAAFLAPWGIPVSTVVLDQDDNIVYAGSIPGPERIVEGLHWNSYMARMSADGRRLLSFKEVDLVPERLAPHPDGGLWLATNASTANLPVFGPLARPMTGTNLASWNPENGEWSARLDLEMSARGSVKVFGHPDRPGEFLALAGASLFRSTDSGSSWKLVNLVVDLNLTWPLSDPNRLYAWTDRLKTSTDNGSTWTTISFPRVVPGSMVAAVAVSPSDPRRLAVLTTSNEVVLSSDAGLVWRNATDWDWRLPGDRVAGIAFENGEAGRLLAVFAEDTVRVYEENRWKILNRPPQPSWISRKQIHHVGSELVISSYGAGASFISRDYGKSWSKLAHCECPLYINPARPNEWWMAGGQGSWRSVDGGANWSKLAPLPNASWITYIAFAGRESAPLASTVNTTDVYLQKLTPEWEVESATFWGGSASEYVFGLFPEPDGALTLVTSTSSFDFPTTPDALLPGRPIGGLGFTRFSPAQEVLYSSTWGGSFAEETQRVTPLPNGRGLMWCGSTYLSDFPALTPPAPTIKPAFKYGFAAGYDSTTNSWLPAYSFGAGLTIATGCAALPDGRWVVAGTTTDEEFPLVRPLLPTDPGPGTRIFVSIVRPPR